MLGDNTYGFMYLCKENLHTSLHFNCYCYCNCNYNMLDKASLSNNSISIQFWLEQNEIKRNLESGICCIVLCCKHTLVVFVLNRMERNGMECFR